MSYPQMPVNMLGLAVLTQEKIHIVEGKEIKILHPITYMSGLFRGSQKKLGMFD